MAIKMHTEKLVENEFGNKVPGWLVHCENCGAVSKTPGIDAGEAAESSRKEGFTTRPNGSFPSIWLCHKCEARSVKRRK